MGYWDTEKVRSTQRYMFSQSLRGHMKFEFADSSDVLSQSCTQTFVSCQTPSLRGYEQADVYTTFMYLYASPSRDSIVLHNQILKPWEIHKQLNSWQHIHSIHIFRQIAGHCCAVYSYIW